MSDASDFSPDDERSGTPVDPEHAAADEALIDALPGLFRLTGGVWWRTAQWAVLTSAQVSSRLMQAALSRESAARLLEDVEGEMREYALRILGLGEGDHRRGPGAGHDDGARASAGYGGAPASLRERGAELLRRSADVTYDEAAHPAYERILGELAPDEGRILRLLVLEGPQTAIDVRTSKTLNVTSELVAPGITMIAAQAGCRYVERVPGYLNNLYRLGLIWFSREPLAEQGRYQVLEAQPDALQALRSGKGRGRLSRTVRRSILLTPFGEDFCRVCLPLETAELDALPADVAVSAVAAADVDAAAAAAEDAAEAGEVARETETAEAAEDAVAGKGPHSSR
ncbi:MAG: Abi-alpha family protein [Solirubrobacteraceae bacterium]